MKLEVTNKPLATLIDQDTGIDYGNRCPCCNSDIYPRIWFGLTRHLCTSAHIEAEKKVSKTC